MGRHCCGVWEMEALSCVPQSASVQLAGYLLYPSYYNLWPVSAMPVQPAWALPSGYSWVILPSQILNDSSPGVSNISCGGLLCSLVRFTVQKYILSAKLNSHAPSPSHISSNQPKQITSVMHMACKYLLKFIIPFLLPMSLLGSLLLPLFCSLSCYWHCSIMLKIVFRPI